MNETIIRRYTDLIANWIPCAMQDIYSCPDRDDLRYYGDGTNGWGVQTNQKALAAIAVLAASPLLDEQKAGATREELLELARSMLRYSLASHLSGDYHTTDSDSFRWGHTWISALGVERMMHGVMAIYDRLDDREREMLRAMLISESDWLLDEYPVRAGLTKDNKPESNMWNGSILFRTAALYPDAPNAEAYVEKAKVFFANAISCPADESSEELWDGKPLKDYFVGANYFDSMACDHHGYMNVGYMVITISNLAMLHFELKRLHITPPALLYHHLEESWRLVRTCLFDDGRLFRIGGDTRIRYCYCQDYLIPALLLAADRGLLSPEEAERLESGWLGQVEKEVAHNGDHSFLSDRCELFVEKSPLYYTRLESDRAVSLSYAALWHREDMAMSPSRPPEPLALWHDDYHGSCLVRGENRMASFTWIAAEPPCGLCVPPSDSSMAEWQFNMTSQIKGDGFSERRILQGHSERMFEGGFSTCGAYLSHTVTLIAEQLNEEDTALCDVAFAALPDDATVITLQRATAPKRVHLSEVKALRLNIPNDIFNGFARDYREENGCLTVDGRLCVLPVYGGEIDLYRPDFRQIGIVHNCPYPTRGMLHCDEVTLGHQTKPRWYAKGESIYDFAAAVVCLGQDRPDVKVRRLPITGKDARAVGVTACDGKEYLVAANFSDASSVFTVFDGRPITVALNAHDCRVFCF